MHKKMKNYSGLFLVFIISIIIAISSSDAIARAPQSCPSKLTVTASGISPVALNNTILGHSRLLDAWKSLSGANNLKSQLSLFASERPELSSTACMANPGACLVCYYHDDLLPANPTRIHSLHYLPAVSFKVDGQQIHNPELSWMNTQFVSQGQNFQIGLYLKSFSNLGVVLDTSKPLPTLQMTDLVDTQCQPTFIADAEIPCPILIETLATVKQFQVR